MKSPLYKVQNTVVIQNYPAVLRGDPIKRVKEINPKEIV